MNKRVILVVEDSPTDEALLLRALHRAGITNPIVTVKDGLEATQYLFGTGRYELRDSQESPALVLIDLNLPKILEKAYGHMFCGVYLQALDSGGIGAGAAVEIGEP